MKEAFAGSFGGARALEGYAERFIPAGRLGTPEDIGRLVAFLCSPAGEWITGARFVVDGGESLASPRILERSVPRVGEETGAG